MTAAKTRRPSVVPERLAWNGWGCLPPLPPRFVSPRTENPGSQLNDSEPRKPCQAFLWGQQMPRVGIEPTTLRVRARNSLRLSYRGICPTIDDSHKGNKPQEAA